MANSNLTKQESEMIAKIVRAVGSYSTIRNVDLILSLQAAHSFCPLRLEDMVLALDDDKRSVTHDVFGIHANLNKKTCQFDNCFWPRFHC